LSVRRLAKEQPPSFAFSPDSMEKVNFWLGKYPEHRKQSASIPLLWLVQKQEGWVSEPAIRLVAEMLSVPVIRIYEVATFYTMFMLEPVGSAALIQVCGTTPCALRGANDLIEICKTEIGPKSHLSADGLFTWEEVECLGACCNAPMAAINDYYYEDLTPESFRQIIADFRAGKKPAPGSYAGRRSSEPAGGAQTLSDASLYDGSRAQPLAKIPNAPEPEPKPEPVA
jgi:NADH-quinone oxidoreductase subunit E